jgi:hypothetical protein
MYFTSLIIRCGDFVKTTLCESKMRQYIRYSQTIEACDSVRVGENCIMRSLRTCTLRLV